MTNYYGDDDDRRSSAMAPEDTPFFYFILFLLEVSRSDFLQSSIFAQNLWWNSFFSPTRFPLSPVGINFQKDSRCLIWISLRGIPPRGKLYGTTPRISAIHDELKRGFNNKLTPCCCCCQYYEEARPDRTDHRGRGKQLVRIFDQRIWFFCVDIFFFLSSFQFVVTFRRLTCESGCVRGNRTCVQVVSGIWIESFWRSDSGVLKWF